MMEKTCSETHPGGYGEQYGTRGSWFSPVIRSSSTFTAKRPSYHTDGNHKPNDLMRRRGLLNAYDPRCSCGTLPRLRLDARDKETA